MGIKNFRDLTVYKNLYCLQLEILGKVIPTLPTEEKYDLAKQMRRACKAPPALLAEGFAKRKQTKHWAKYIDDATGECYEMINHLHVCIDAYSQYVNINYCKKLIKRYDICCAQLYRLKESWHRYHLNNH